MMLNPNVVELLDNLRLNINLVYIRYRVIETDLNQIVVIDDYAVQFNEMQNLLKNKNMQPFDEWLVHPLNYDVTKKYVNQISIVELKNTFVKVGVSKFNAIDESWNDLFDIYRGYSAQVSNRLASFNSP